MAGSPAQLALPVARHPAGPARRGLIGRPAQRRRKCRAVRVVLSPVVPEPVLARLEAPDHRVPGAGEVRARMLARRGVAAADVPAGRAPPQMEPPSGTLACQAVLAPGAAGHRCRVDVAGLGHRLIPRTLADVRLRPTVTARAAGPAGGTTVAGQSRGKPAGPRHR